MTDLRNAPLLAEAKMAKHKPHIVLQILIFFAVFIVSSLLTGIVIGIPIAFSIFKSIDATILGSGDIAAITQAAFNSINQMPDWMSAVMLFATVISTLCGIIYCLKIEGRSLASMGMRKKGFLKNYGQGYLVGVVMIAAAVGLSMLLGGTGFAGFNAKVSWLYVGLFFLGFLVQGMSEEVLVRGYFMVSCANKVHISIAIVVSSVLFAVLHLANNGITALAFVNLVLFGVFTAVYMLRTNDLWRVCAMHASWNFFQGHIFGISVSGTAVGNSVFATTFNEGTELVSGGSFGIEGGICTTIVLVAGTLLVLLLPQKKRLELSPLSQESEGKMPPSGTMPVYIEK